MRPDTTALTKVTKLITNGVGHVVLAVEQQGVLKSYKTNYKWVRKFAPAAEHQGVLESLKMYPGA